MRWRIAVVLLMFLSGLLLVIANVWVHATVGDRQRQFAANAELTQARVLAVQHDSLRVEYETQAGSQVADLKADHAEAHQPRDEIQVLVDPSDPTEVHLPGEQRSFLDGLLVPTYDHGEAAGWLLILASTIPARRAHRMQRILARYAWRPVRLEWPVASGENLIDLNGSLVSYRGSEQHGSIGEVAGPSSPGWQTLSVMRYPPERGLHLMRGPRPPSQATVRALDDRGQGIDWPVLAGGVTHDRSGGLGVLWCIIFVATWWASERLTRAILETAGVNTNPRLIALSADSSQPGGSIAPLAGGLVVAMVGIWAVKGWYATCRQDLRRRRWTQRHPGLFLAALLAGLGLAIVTVDPLVDRLEKDARHAAIIDEALGMGVTLEQATCLADGFRYGSAIRWLGLEMKAEEAAGILRLSLACHGLIQPGGDTCTVDELSGLIDVDTWEYPADAAFPFERGLLDRRQVEQATVRCSRSVAVRG